MKNRFYMTIYDMYEGLGLSDKELTAYIWNEVFKGEPIDFSGEELVYGE